MIQFRNLRISKFPRSSKAWKATIWCKIGPSSIAYHETAYTKVNLQKRILVLFSERNNGIFYHHFQQNSRKIPWNPKCSLLLDFLRLPMAPLFTLPKIDENRSMNFPNISAMHWSPSTWYNGQALNASSLSSRSIALSITPWEFSQLPGKFTNHG